MLKGLIWQADSFGSPENVITLKEHIFAPPSAGRIIVRVAAAGVAMPDVLLLQGAYPGVNNPPITPGQEVVGEVVEVAPHSAFRVGDRVMGMTPFSDGLGGCAEFAYVNEAKAILAPTFSLTRKPRVF